MDAVVVLPYLPGLTMDMPDPSTTEVEFFVYTDLGMANISSSFKIRVKLRLHRTIQDVTNDLIRVLAALHLPWPSTGSSLFAYSDSRPPRADALRPDETVQDAEARVLYTGQVALVPDVLARQFRSFAEVTEVPSRSFFSGWLGGSRRTPKRRAHVKHPRRQSRANKRRTTKRRTTKRRAHVKTPQHR